MDGSWAIMFNILRELSKTPCNCGNNGDNEEVNNFTILEDTCTQNMAPETSQM